CTDWQTRLHDAFSPIAQASMTPHGSHAAQDKRYRLPMLENNTKNLPPLALKTSAFSRWHREFDHLTGE
ncbi:MAG: hypothetical protein AAFR26_18745, partial [Cyanobacteria bacterium J06626_4]